MQLKFPHFPFSFISSSRCIVEINVIWKKTIFFSEWQKKGGNNYSPQHIEKSHSKFILNTWRDSTKIIKYNVHHWHDVKKTRLFWLLLVIED